MSIVELTNDELFLKVEDFIKKISDSKYDIDRFTKELQSAEIEKVKKEYELMMTTNFKDLGITNKEGREAYIASHDDIVGLEREINALNIAISEEKNSISYLDDMKKLFNRMIDMRIKQ